LVDLGGLWLYHMTGGRAFLKNTALPPCRGIGENKYKTRSMLGRHRHTDVLSARVVSLWVNLRRDKFLLSTTRSFLMDFRLLFVLGLGVIIAIIIYPQQNKMQTIRYTGSSAKRILKYWFEEGGIRIWFPRTTEDREKIDAYIKENFDQDLEKAIHGDLDEAKWTTPTGMLAKVILLDQFSRNLFRNTAKAFSQDDMALNISYAAIKDKMDVLVNPTQRCFYYMPFMHSESLLVQERGFQLFTKLEQECKESAEGKLVAEFAKSAKQHLDIIARFNRFPHRNEILGRESTAEEIEFLKQPGNSFK